MLGRRMPISVVTAAGPRRVFTLLHEAQPVLINLGEPGGFDITPWRIGSSCRCRLWRTWELPVLGNVAAPAALLILPDGYVAWWEWTQVGWRTRLPRWFGPPA